jgi:sugar phosphate isomerase/epimerase
MNFKLALTLPGTVCLLTTISSAADSPKVPPPVPGYPIGRCVQVISPPGAGAITNFATPEEAKQVGFEYLELALPALLPLSDDDFAKQVARLRGIGLPLLSGYGFLPGNLKVIGPNVDPGEVDRAVRYGLSRAKQLGLSFVMYGNGLTTTRRVPAGFPRATARKQFLEFIRRAGAEAKKQGITILIEPLPPASTDLINTVAEGLEFVEKVGRPNVQLLVEYSKFVESKEDLSVIRRAAPHIRQVEIENPNGWVYPASVDEADYASFFRALKDGGYRGGFSIHGKPGNVFVTGPRAIAVLRTLAAPLAVKAEKGQ